MGGPPKNRDETCEIARGPFFHAEVSRSIGPVLAAPGALREDYRGKSSYNLIANRPGPRNGSQLCYRQHKGLFIYILTSPAPSYIKIVWLHPVCFFVKVFVLFVVCTPCVCSLFVLMVGCLGRRLLYCCGRLSTFCLEVYVDPSGSLSLRALCERLLKMAVLVSAWSAMVRRRDLGCSLRGACLH